MLNPRSPAFKIVLSSWLLAAGMAVPALAITPAEADAAFKALNQVYWDPQTKFFRKEETGAKKADFWLEAQLWDTVMDEYDRAPREAVKQQINDLYDGFIADHPDWTKNKYNDDIMWWTIGCARAYQITGNERYLKKAKESFDFVYDNFHDDKLGGGIWWTSDRGSKNSCIVSPAVIAAMRLCALLKDEAYFARAKSLYQWQKNTLTDGKGKVYDNMRYDRPGTSTNSASQDRRRNRSPLSTFSLTYNQGTYIGASVLLYLKTGDAAFLDQAKMAADWTRENLCTGEKRILKSEGQGDGGAFKGIFVRYMKLLTREGGCPEFLPWMRTNADTAWSNRRPSDNIMGADWSAPAPNGIQSQTAGSAVSVVICFADEPAK